MSASGRASIGLALVALLLAACSSDGTRCRALPLAPVALTQLDAASAALDFAPTAPCGTPSTMRITRIALDSPDRAPRITFVVEADQQLMLVSQSRSTRVPTQIPDGASHINWNIGGVRVSGFEQPAGAGPAVLYLRWITHDIVHEFQAAPSSRYSATALRDLARANVAATLRAAAVSATEMSAEAPVTP